MKKKDTISIVHITLIIMTAIGLNNHVTIIPHVLSAAKRDSWISLLIALVIILLWGSLLIYIHKGTGQQNIFEWIEQHIGKLPKWVLSVFISLVFVLLAAITLREMVSWTKVSYLMVTPSVFQIVLFVLLCFFLALTSIQTMAIVNFFLLSAIIVFGFFVGIANFQFKDFSLLKPVLEHGFKPVFSGLIYPLSGMVELIALLFIQQKLHDKVTYKDFFINSIIITWLTVGPLIGAIIEFGPNEAARQRFPAFEEWSLVTIGRYIEHVDFLAIYQWTSGAFIRMSFLLFIALEVFQLKNKRKRLIVLSIFSVIIIILNLIPLSDLTLYHLQSTIFMPLTFWFFLTVSLLLSLFVFIGNRKKRRKSDVQKNEKTSLHSE